MESGLKFSKEIEETAKLSDKYKQIHDAQERIKFISPPDIGRDRLFN